MILHHNTLDFLNVAESSIVFPQLSKIVFCACTANTVCTMMRARLSGQAQIRSTQQQEELQLCSAAAGAKAAGHQANTAWLEAQVQGCKQL